MSSKKNKALFLDRDGIINVDHGYVFKISDFAFSEGICELLSAASSKGYLLIVVTNQSGIARGYYSQEDYDNLTSYYVDALKREGITLAAVYHCPHAPEEACQCRKPNPGMFYAAQKEFSLDMHASWMIGDKESDMIAAKKAGVAKRILVSKAGSKEATFCVENISKIHELLD